MSLRDDPFMLGLLSFSYTFGGTGAVHVQKDDDTPNMNRDRPQPELKPAPHSPPGSVDGQALPSKLLIPRANKFSPSSSRNSSISGGTPPQRLRGGSLNESLEVALGERSGVGGERRIIVNASLG